MGLIISKDRFNDVLKNLSEKYEIYAPVNLKGKGTFSDTDRVRYGLVSSIEEIVVDVKSHFSFKEILLPITQTLFYFTEEQWIEPKIDRKEILVFLRSCDLQAVKRIDEIYLKNGDKDPYYKAIRDNVKFILMGCSKSFENCFCVSMGTNKSDKYYAAINFRNDVVELDVKDEELLDCFNDVEGRSCEVKPDYVTENSVKVNIPENLDQRIYNSDMWKEYNSRCISCGRCNFVCPTCTCFSMQDIFYKDNEKTGERRRVWASCHVDNFTVMAGGHEFRKSKSERMRFKVMHKVYDFKKKFGYHMCVGCGRCDDICPEYISFSNCVNKLNDAMEGEK